MKRVYIKEKGCSYPISKNERGYYISIPFMLIDRNCWPLIEGPDEIFEGEVIKEIRDRRGNIVPILSLTPHKCGEIPCGGRCFVCGEKNPHNYKEAGTYQDSSRCGTILKCTKCGAEYHATQYHTFEIDKSQWVLRCTHCGFEKPLEITPQEVEELKKLSQEYDELLRELRNIKNDDKIERSVLFWTNFGWEWLENYAPSEAKKEIPQFLFDYNLAKNRTLILKNEGREFLLIAIYHKWDYSLIYRDYIPVGREEIIIKKFTSFEEVLKYFDVYSKDELELLSDKKEELKSRLKEIETCDLMRKVDQVARDLWPTDAIFVCEAAKLLINEVYRK